MRWYVGLGNPGKQYAATRHNAGFMALDLFAEKWNLSFSKKQCKSEIAEGVVNDEKVVLIKPQTYMNLSGEAVRAYLDYYKADLDDLVVLYDDMDTDTGKIRLRYQGSAGGHNGIKSIIQHLGTQQFQRIRIGISRPVNSSTIVDYVLSPFAKGERELVQQSLDNSVAAMEFFLKEPFEKAMGRFNG